MAHPSGSLLLVLVWTLLTAGSQGSPPEEPCDQHTRYRQSPIELGGTWVSTVAVLSSICATWLFVFYALRCLCPRKGPCGRGAEGEADAQGEGSRVSCAETREEIQAPCTSSSLPRACAQPRCSSRTPVYTQVQRAYARQLACMEKQLEAFLREVRARRCALGELALEEPCPQQENWEADKLCITVYEVADSEGVAGGRGLWRSRRRRVR